MEELMLSLQMARSLHLDQVKPLNLDFLRMAKSLTGLLPTTFPNGMSSFLILEDQLSSLLIKQQSMMS